MGDHLGIPGAVIFYIFYIFYIFEDILLHAWSMPCLKQSLSSHSQPFLFHVDSTFTQIHFLHMTWDVAGWLGMDQNSLRYKWRLFKAFHRLRPHHVEYTGSRPITVVKQRRARSVLGMGDHLGIPGAVIFYIFYIFYIFEDILLHAWSMPSWNNRYPAIHNLFCFMLIQHSLRYTFSTWLGT